jgi:hypothetical protein
VSRAIRLKIPFTVKTARNQLKDADTPMLEEEAFSVAAVS